MKTKRRPEPRGSGRPPLTSERLVGDGITAYHARDPYLGEVQEHILAFKSGQYFDVNVKELEQWATATLKNSKTKERSKPQSLANYAHLCIQHINFIRGLIRNANADLSASYAMELGELAAEVRIKFLHEATWLRGNKFKNSKRGLNRLNRNAKAILEQNGKKYSAKNVLRDLETFGLATSDGTLICWLDDQLVNRKTSFHQFQSGLSRIRAKLN